MAIVSLSEARVYLRIDHGEEDALLQALLDRAQNLVERHLGYTITSEFGGVGQDPIPPALGEAICQLAAWWYETRGMPSEEAREMPLSVREIVTEYREFTF